jgi:hypothetical protein
MFLRTRHTSLWGCLELREITCPFKWNKYECFILQVNSDPIQIQWSSSRIHRSLTGGESHLRYRVVVPARQLRSLACRYANNVPELTLSPFQGSMNSATDLQNTKLSITYQKINLLRICYLFSPDEGSLPCSSIAGPSVKSWSWVSGHRGTPSEPGLKNKIYVIVG